MHCGYYFLTKYCIYIYFILLLYIPNRLKPKFQEKKNEFSTINKYTCIKRKSKKKNSKKVDKNKYNK